MVAGQPVRTSTTSGPPRGRDSAVILLVVPRRGRHTPLPRQSCDADDPCRSTSERGHELTGGSFPRLLSRNPEVHREVPGAHGGEPAAPEPMVGNLGRLHRTSGCTHRRKLHPLASGRAGAPDPGQAAPGRSVRSHERKGLGWTRHGTCVPGVQPDHLTRQRVRSARPTGSRVHASSVSQHLAAGIAGSLRGNENLIVEPL